MSVYKSKASPYYQYDFWFNGRRFHKTTKARNKRDAEAIERQVKQEAKRDAEHFSKTGNAPMTIDTAVGRFWTEKGQFLANKDRYFAVLERIVLYFGKDKRLDQIDDEAITALVAHRRNEFRWGKSKLKHGELKTLSNGTINRCTLAPLKTMFRRARVLWHIYLPHEPHWKDHWLKEPKERVRELHRHELVAIDRSVREDYKPWHLFLHLSGRRLNETLLRWSDVNWEAREITTGGKGGVTVWTPITPSIREILESCRGHHPEFVFTFIAQRSRGEKIAGQRYPITRHGALTQWGRDRARSGVKDFRLHDLRHDTGTKVLRRSKNLKLVQRVLNHANIATTAKYTHVMDDEVARALEGHAKSRNKSRTNLSDAARPTDSA